jgi:hypothetical protein
MALTNERLRQMVFESVTDVRTKFIVEALAVLLESQVGVGAVDDILDELIPVAPNTQTVLFGHKLGDYSGMDRTTLKAKFTKPDGSALTDADVDDIFEALGVVSGTAVPFEGFVRDKGTEQAGQTKESSGAESVKPQQSEVLPSPEKGKKLENLAPTQNLPKQVTTADKKDSGKK